MLYNLLEWVLRSGFLMGCTVIHSAIKGACFGKHFRLRLIRLKRWHLLNGTMKMTFCFTTIGALGSDYQSDFTEPFLRFLVLFDSAILSRASFQHQVTCLACSFKKLETNVCTSYCMYWSVLFHLVKGIGRFNFVVRRSLKYITWALFHLAVLCCKFAENNSCWFYGRIHGCL